MGAGDPTAVHGRSLATRARRSDRRIRPRETEHIPECRVLAEPGLRSGQCARVIHAQVLPVSGSRSHPHTEPVLRACAQAQRTGRLVGPAHRLTDGLRLERREGAAPGRDLMNVTVPPRSLSHQIVVASPTPYRCFRRIEFSLPEPGPAHNLLAETPARLDRRFEVQGALLPR